MASDTQLRHASFGSGDCDYLTEVPVPARPGSTRGFGRKQCDYRSRCVVLLPLWRFGYHGSPMASRATRLMAGKCGELSECFLHLISACYGRSLQVCQTSITSQISAATNCHNLQSPHRYHTLLRLTNDQRSLAAHHLDLWRSSSVSVRCVPRQPSATHYRSNISRLHIVLYGIVTSATSQRARGSVGGGHTMADPEGCCRCCLLLL